MNDTLHALISRRAYEIWTREGYPENQDWQHWERAERELEIELGGVDGMPQPFEMTDIELDRALQRLKSRGALG